MKSSSAIILSLLIYCFSSCSNESGGSSATLRQSIGNTNDVLVIADTTLIKSEVGEVFRSYFQQPYGVLPQPEPFFNLTKIPSTALNRLLKKSKNMIFLADLSDRNLTSKYVLENLISSEKVKQKVDVNKPYHYFHIRNLWAKPQLITVVVGKTKQELLAGFHQDKKTILHTMNDFENHVLSEKVKKTKTSATIHERLLEEHLIDIHIPEQFREGRQAPTFTWYMKDIKEGYLNIVVYNRAYVDTNNFSPNSIITSRDSILGKYILGQSEGSVMTTELQANPQVRTTMLDGAYTKEVKGLWRLSKDFMGGPFISYSIYNEAAKNITTVEGFVTAPGTGKKKYMKELEAILSTIQLKKAS